MLFAIHAFEQRYGGMHGIEDYAVIEADSYDEAVDYARDLSLDVISDYVYEELLDELGLVFDNCISDQMEDDIAYEIWQVKNDTGYSLDVLTDMLYNNPDEFVKNYCNKWE